MVKREKYIDIQIETPVRVDEFETGYYETEETNEPYFYNGKISLWIEKLFERDVTMIEHAMNWEKPIKMTLTLRFE